jgi:hypothetical protein
MLLFSFYMHIFLSILEYFFIFYAFIVVYNNKFPPMIIFIEKWSKMKIIEYITLEDKRQKLSKFLVFYFVFLIFPSPFNNVVAANAVTTKSEVVRIDTQKEYTKVKKINDQRSDLAHQAALHIGLPKSEKIYAGLSKVQADAVVAIADNFPAKHFRKAVRIAWCESRLNPAAINKANSNGTADRGLFQLNDGGTMQRLGITKHTAFDPHTNAEAAYVLFEDRGWQPWVCRYKIKK